MGWRVLGFVLLGGGGYLEEKRGMWGLGGDGGDGYWAQIRGAGIPKQTNQRVRNVWQLICRNYANIRRRPLGSGIGSLNSLAVWIQRSMAE